MIICPTTEEQRRYNLITSTIKAWTTKSQFIGAEEQLIDDIKFLTDLIEVKNRQKYLLPTKYTQILSGKIVNGVYHCDISLELLKQMVTGHYYVTGIDIDEFKDSNNVTMYVYYHPPKAEGVE